MLKRCAGCRLPKPEADYYVDGYSHTRRRTRCMACMKAAAKARYWRDPEPIRARARARKARLRISP